jgi:hypothetical protein
MYTVFLISRKEKHTKIWEHWEQTGEEPPHSERINIRMYDEHRESIEKVLTDFPQLSAKGLCPWYPVKPPAEILAKREDGRMYMLSDRGREEFDRACRWLRKFNRRKTVHRGCSSYTWKHRAESEEGGYVSNGALIAAALSLGFTVHHVIPTFNAYVGIGKRLKGE